MFKEFLRTFSKILGCAVLITLTMGHNVKASDELLAFVYDPPTCAQTHAVLHHIGTNLDVTEVTGFRTVDRLDSSEKLPRPHVLGCRVCNKFIPGLGNLQVATKEGDYLLRRAIQTYLIKNPYTDLSGLAWGSIPTGS